MGYKSLPVKRLADHLNELKAKQQDERCQLHQWYKTQTRISKTKRRTAYKKLKTQQERAILLTASVQKLNQLKQTHTLKYEHLLTRQAQQRENLRRGLADSAELDRRKRINLARSIIGTAIKSGTLLLSSELPETT